MHSFAHYALPICIGTSAFGALLLCLLALRYDFIAGDDEHRETAWRRRFTTSLGHAAAVVCFALTGGMAAVVLAMQSRPATQPMPPLLARMAPAASAAVDLRPVTDEQARLRKDVENLERRLAEAEGALERVAGENGRLVAKVRELERTTVAMRAAESGAKPRVASVTRATRQPPASTTTAASAAPTKASAPSAPSIGASAPTAVAPAVVPGRGAGSDSQDVAGARSRGVSEPAPPARRGEDDIQAATRPDRREAMSALPRDVVTSGPPSRAPSPEASDDAGSAELQRQARKFADDVQRFFSRVGRVLKRTMD
jgi:hypothetical protein